MLRAVPTAPVTPCTGPKPLEGGNGCPLRVSRPPLGRFDVIRARTLALAVTREFGLSSTDERVSGHVTEVTQALKHTQRKLLGPHWKPALISVIYAAPLTFCTEFSWNEVRAVTVHAMTDGAGFNHYTPQCGAHTAT